VYEETQFKLLGIYELALLSLIGKVVRTEECKHNKKHSSLAAKALNVYCNVSAFGMCVPVCVCVRAMEKPQTEMCVCLGPCFPFFFPVKGGLGVLAARATTGPALLFATTHSSNQAGCQTNR